jgi:putative transposase
VGSRHAEKGNGGAEMVTLPVSRKIDCGPVGQWARTAVRASSTAGACWHAQLCGLSLGKLKLGTVLLSADFDWKHGRLPRLRSHDYSAAATYFVTMNVFGRAPLFGSIRGQGIVLNEYGMIAEEEWRRCKHLRSEVDLGTFVIMPNHLHGIVTIAPHAVTRSRANCEGTRAHRPGLHRCPRSLGALVAGFKSSTTKRINLLRSSPAATVWQRNYHEHVIRNDKELAAISEYILNNPLKAARKGRS